MVASTVELVANEHCALGENPLWDERRKEVLWVDINPGVLWAYDPKTGKTRVIHEGVTTGGFTLQEDGSFLLFQSNSISRLDSKGCLSTIAENIDSEMSRFNDVIADPAGRVFAGTIGQNDKGGLYLLERDGTVKCLFKGTGCSNGMGFSPDYKKFYWTDSTARRIDQFDYDQSTGALSNRSIFVEVPVEEGVPDGLEVDVDGNIWSARWDGFSVRRYDSQGRQLQPSISLPVAKVTSICFGGEELNELYITSAGGAKDSATLDGALFHTQVDVPGSVSFRSKIRL